VTKINKLLTNVTCANFQSWWQTVIIDLNQTTKNEKSRKTENLTGYKECNSGVASFFRM